MSILSKNILRTMLVCTGFAALVACTDDKGSNPTLIQPTEFKLNDPACGKTTVELAASQSLQFSWSQPKYTANNAPINATYEIQLSTTGTFQTNIEEAKPEENIFADYAVLDETFLTCTAEVPASSINKALVKIGSWQSEAEVPNVQDIYFRVRAYIKEGAKQHNEIVSNTVRAKVSPYYIELKPADPMMWYLVGNIFGDASWGKTAIGKGSFPMFKVYGGIYDEKTGEGTVTYTNYFEDNGEWKIQPADFDWNYGFMGSGNANEAVYRDGGGDNGNIKCSPAGIYKVSVTTPGYICKIEPYEEVSNPTVYPEIDIAGDFDDWKGTKMEAVYNGANNHVWCYIANFENFSKIKFKIPESWDTNWGFGNASGDVNLVGVCTAGGNDIGVNKGKWCIMFNDITGEFSIINIE